VFTVRYDLRLQIRPFPHERVISSSVICICIYIYIYTYIM